MHVVLTPSLAAGMQKLHAALKDLRGVASFSDSVRMALARGIRQLQGELETEGGAKTRQAAAGEAAEQVART
jgi:hypothetical protein